MIYDTHAHLDLLKNLDEAIVNAKKANVKAIVTNSVNISSLKKSLEIRKKYPEIVKVAAGLYPEENLSLEDFNEIKTIIQNNKSQIVAMGEIGLDFSQEKPSKEIQKEIFIKQLDLAKELNLPAIIHTRKAEKEVLEILDNRSSQKIILHCFSGNFKLINKAKELNIYLSIPTNIVRSEHFQKIVKEYPKNLILTETDAPYLSPHKDKPNEPAFIAETIRKISEIWGISEREVEKIIESNSLCLFTIVKR